MKGSGDMSAQDDRAKSGANGKAAVKPRVKREPPLRGGPVRNVTMAFRSPESAAPESGAASSAPPPVEGPRGVVEQAVATAYRVFEEYMQRGRQAAHRQHQTEETGGPMRQQDPAAMAMQYWTNMAQTWFGAMAPFMAWGMPGMPGAGRTWDQGGPMAGAPPATTVGHRLALAVEVTSPHPTEVRVSLHDQRSALKPLRVQDLETDGGEKLPSSAIHFEPAGYYLRVRVQVPEHTPPGVYSGPIIDKERSGVGKLEVVIHRRP